MTTIFTYPRPNSWFSNVLLARDGNLYGTVIEYTSNRPVSSAFFQLTPSGVFTRLSASEIFIHLLYRTVFEGSDGNFYGTALFQDNTISKILRISRDGTVTILNSLNMGQAFSGPSVIQGRDGILYGTVADLNPDGFAGSTRLFRLAATPNLSVARPSNAEITLTWNSFTGGVYRVDYKSSLSDLDWMPLAPDVTARNELTSLTDNLLAARQRYYRVRLQP